MRYFRASEEVYEQARLTLDQAWGLPDGTGTQTCYMPAEMAVRDFAGRCLLAVSEEFLSFSVAVDLLPQLIASGAVEEISEADYWASNA